MNAPPRIEIADHTDLATARRIHDVQMRAYAQEAALLGAKRFPPLERTVQDIATSTETFFAAFLKDELVGALGVTQDASAGSMSIDSLVVSPACQRRGIARSLLDAVLASRPRREWVVQTGAKNFPAIALYTSCGFVVTETFVVGDEALALVKLHRPPANALSFARVHASDAQALADLRVEAMRESLERVGRFDPERARSRFLAGFTPEATRAILCDGERVGFFVVRREADGLLLDHLYVRLSHQARGIGAAVLAHVFAEADAKALAVRVGALRESDSNRFYQRHGFELIEQAQFDNYYVRRPVY